MSSPSISVVVLNYGQAELTDACLRSLSAAVEHVPGAEILVIDNGSADNSVEILRARHPDVRLEALSENLGFAGGVNRGIASTSGAWVAVVNNDVELDPTTLVRMLAAGERDGRIGAVAPQIRFHARPDLVNSAGLEVDGLGIGFERLAGRGVDDRTVMRGEEVFGSTGCVALYRRAMLEDVRGFDASFFAYLEDVDVAWRARMRGWRAVYEPTAVAYHHASSTVGEGSTLKYFLVGRNRVRLLAKNASTRQLLRWGIASVVYDIAYVVFVLMSDRTLAPIRGRLRGLREWRRYRRLGASERRTLRLGGVAGVRGSMRMRAAYREGGS